MTEPLPSHDRLLVLLAFDDRDSSLLAAVERLAPTLGVQRVIAAHVYPRDPFPAFLQGAAPSAEAGANPAELDVALDRLKAALPACEVVGIHATGNPAEEVARVLQAEDVDLLVMGRNPRISDGPGWGPSGLTLLRAAPVTTLVVPAGTELVLKRAVCGVDFSHTSSRALAVASAFVPRLDAVFQYSLSSVGPRQQEAEFEAELRANVERHFTDDIVARLQPGTQTSISLSRGDKASQVLIDEAGGDLIVVGSRGLSRFAARLLGSTAERLAGYANGPVLIVRKKGETLGLLEGLVHR